MVDDTLYITPHETALAVVATSMKKARLRLHILIVDSIMGGVLFSAGGMLYVMCEAEDAGLIDRGCRGIVSLFQGAVYALGLFFVIETGMDLFNSNVLFFTVGVLRGAVSVVDLVISWTVSFWVNLASTIFVVYVICYLGGILKNPQYVEGTLRIAKRKIQATFMETFVRAIAGNFCVCLATYMQMMVKPPHVKFLMLFFPIFTFVAMGFTHVVADMFLVPCGIFNHCGYGFGRYFWKIMLPGALGSIVGGVFFSVMIPWLLHIVVIEQDMKKLNLPAYEEKDEQPMLNMDSRVVRVDHQSKDAARMSADRFDSGSLSGSEKEYEEKTTGLKTYTSATCGAAARARSVSASKVGVRRVIRSPKGVFPVAGMGPPLRKERTIASAYTGVGESGESGEKARDEDEDLENQDDKQDGDELVEDNPCDAEQCRMSTGLMRALTRVRTKARGDIENAVCGSTEGGVLKGENPLKRMQTRIKRGSSTAHGGQRGQERELAALQSGIRGKHRGKSGQSAANPSAPHRTQKHGVRQMIASRRMGRDRDSSLSFSPNTSSSVRTLTPTLYGVDDGEGDEDKNSESSDCESVSINSENPVSLISDSSAGWEQRHNL